MPYTCVLRYWFCLDVSTIHGLDFGTVLVVCNKLYNKRSKSSGFYLQYTNNQFTERLYNKRSQSIGYHCQYVNQQSTEREIIKYVVTAKRLPLAIYKSSNQRDYTTSGHNQSVTTVNMQINKLFLSPIYKSTNHSHSYII